MASVSTLGVSARNSALVCAPSWLSKSIGLDSIGRGPAGGEVELSQRPLGRLRRLSRRLAHDGHGQKVLELCESELRRLGTRARRAAGLHLLRAELLTHLGRSGEALGQLELLLLRSEELGPAHALLGMLLCSSPSPGDLERALPHLLTATYAPDVEPDEAGECALLLASLLTEAAGGAPRPSQASASTPQPLRPPELGYLERASDLGFIAVPTDFLAEPGDGPLPSSQQSPVPGPPLPDDFTALDEAPPAPRPLTLPTPAELLARAAALLGDDPRPVERQLALAFQRGDLYLALSCCDSLLTRLHEPRERARVLCDKAAVLQKLPAAGSAEPLLHEALALQPDFPPALRALRELLTAEGDLERAVQLLERELRALQAEPEAVEPGAAGPDGEVDASGSHNINLASLLTSRDNLRQAEADLFVVAASIPSMDLDANQVPDFDGSRIAYVGQSLGSIVGTVFMALEPTVNTGVLSVPRVSRETSPLAYLPPSKLISAS